MKRELRDYIKDILDSISDIESFVGGMDFNIFIGDKKTINAVIRSLEIMGEASKKIPEELRAKYPGIPWKRLAGMRDKLIHEYHGIDLEIVWEVIKREIPPLETGIEIEESFPVKEVSRESAREKNIRHGHISTLHIWWARRPLASSRATGYAALV